jgi:hypothetical protein
MGRKVRTKKQNKRRNSKRLVHPKYEHLKVKPKRVGKHKNGKSYIMVKGLEWAPNSARRGEYGVYKPGLSYKGTDGKWHKFT